jgi:hypothetical protein
MAEPSRAQLATELHRAEPSSARLVSSPSWVEHGVARQEARLTAQLDCKDISGLPPGIVSAARVTKSAAY